MSVNIKELKELAQNEGVVEIEALAKALRQYSYVANAIQRAPRIRIGEDLPLSLASAVEEVTKLSNLARRSEVSGYYALVHIKLDPNDQ